jgi:hypothetical protein
MQLGVRTLTFGVEKFRRLGVQLAWNWIRKVCGGKVFEQFGLRSV